jgi:hypothetical protein
MIQKIYIQARCWWLRPEILATQKAQRSGGSQFKASLVK